MNVTDRDEIKSRRRIYSTFFIPFLSSLYFKTENALVSLLRVTYFDALGTHTHAKFVRIHKENK